MTNPLANSSAIWTSSAIRGAIYFTIPTVTTFLTQTETTAALSDFTWFQWSRIILSSLLSGLVAIKAFLDQSLSDTPKQP